GAIPSRQILIRRKLDPQTRTIAVKTARFRRPDRLAIAMPLTRSPLPPQRPLWPPRSRRPQGASVLLELGGLEEARVRVVLEGLHLVVETACGDGPCEGRN